MDIHLTQNTKLCISLFLMLAIGGLGAQTNKTPEHTEADQTIEGIKDYNVDSIKQAGKSGDTGYVPYLQALLIHDDLAASPIEAQATIALVRLGDKREAQKIECELMTNKPGVVDYIAQKILPEIGGWFAIREYFYMLSQDSSYLRELKNYHTDTPGYVLPSRWAVKYLPEVVSDSPLPHIKTLQDSRIPALAERWKLWIRQNRLRLERLQPQGQQGLTFPNVACKNAMHERK